MAAHSTAQVPPIVRVPTPLTLLLSFAAGTGLQLLAPLTLAPMLSTLSRGLGLILLDAGGLLAAATLGLFVLARTTFLPFATASQLVTRGPYRFSRNPMYLSALLTYAGAALHFGQLWALLLLPLPLTLLVKIVVPYEEARLQQIFGEPYAYYCRQVRRWI